MTESEEMPLGRPRIRWWELNETSSIYERAIAAPSDDDLVIMWAVNAVVLAMVSLFVAIVFLGVAAAVAVSIWNQYRLPVAEGPCAQAAHLPKTT